MRRLNLCVVEEFDHRIEEEHILDVAILIVLIVMHYRFSRRRPGGRLLGRYRRIVRRCGA